MSFRESFFLSVSDHLPKSHLFDEYRFVVLKLAGIKISGRCLIWTPLIVRQIGGAKNIFIGNGTFINSECRFGCPVDPVVIGQRVMVGPRVSFETMSHSLHLVAGKGRSGNSKKILVEDDVWIGANCCILDGVTIEKGCVIGAGSVVTKSLPAYSIAIGAPAVVVKKRM